VDYDFTLSNNFSVLSSGSSNASAEFLINYSPKNPDLFSNAHAIIVYNSIQLANSTSIFHFDHQIIEVSKTHSRVKINKYDDTKFLRLKGSLIIVSSLAKGIFYDHLLKS